MARYASVIVRQAQAWIGCKEADGSHRKIIDIYNAHKPLAVGYKVKYTDAWCSTFVSAVAIKCGYTDIIPTECGCGRHIDLFKKKGIWVEADNYKPKAGDIILYDWSDNGVGENTDGADHIGIVEKVIGSTIYVIEGNYSNAVKRRTLQVNSRYIRGFAVPKYDAEATANTTSKKSVEEIAKEVIAGKWGNGADRKKKLADAGYDYSEVQTKVNQLLNGTAKKSVTEIAKEVIAGKWGVGADRKNRLTKAGYSYSEVQAKVNQLMR